MITVNNAVKFSDKKHPNDMELKGLSTDIKPTEIDGNAIAVNSIFLELDTKDFYYYDGEEWQKVEIEESSGEYDRDIAEINRKLKKRVFYFDSVASMKATTDLEDGEYAITKGYYTANDGGGGEYKIVNDNTLIDDGGSVHTLENQLKAKLIVNNGEICYNVFGAKGDGTTDDYNSIKNTHNFANTNNYKVVANSKSVYYVKNFDTTIQIKTNVDWTTARFIIDDTELTVANDLNEVYLFSVEPTVPERDITNLLSGISIKKGQEFITELANNGDCLIRISNSNKKIYIRHGDNPNSGINLFDIFRINNDGKVIDDIVWDFEEITNAELYYIDKEPLTINGGIFTTIVNRYDSYKYFNRGISITRSNVKIQELVHYVSGEDVTTSSPYNSFLSTYHTCSTTIEQCIFTARKYWKTNSGVSKGTYDFSTQEDINLSILNCKSSNSITDKKYWSVFAGNNSKKLLLENCEFNRVGSHMGFWDITIKDSIIGARGMGFMGGGTANFENVKVLNQQYFVELKQDYGASFDGTFNIKNCSISYESETGERLFNIPTIIKAINSGEYDYGIKPTLPILNVENFTFLYGGEGQETCSIFLITYPTQGVDYTKTYEENSNLGYYPQSFFPEINCKNIKLTDKTKQKFRLSSDANIWNAYVSKKGTALNYYDNTNYPSNVTTLRNWEKLVETNCKIILDNCDFPDDYPNMEFSRYRCTLYGTADLNNGEINNNHHFVPEIIIKNIKYPLFLGVGHRAGIFRIRNSIIYTLTTSSTDNLTYCYFDVKDCDFYYHYYNNVYPTGDNLARCRLNWNQFKFENVTFNKDDEAELSDFYTYEIPFGTMLINTTSQNFLRMSGDVINCKFWDSFTSELENTAKFNSGERRNYEYDIKNIGNHKGVKKLPRVYGETNQRPYENSNYIIPRNFIFYDTDLQKPIIWNGTNWIDYTGQNV